MRKVIDIRSLGRFFLKLAAYSLYLNEIRTYLAANLERSPVIHDNGNGSVGDRPAMFVGFTPSFVAFAQ